MHRCSAVHTSADRAIEWRGTVVGVRVVRVENAVESLFDYLPDTVADWLRCVYGTSHMCTHCISLSCPAHPVLGKMADNFL